MQNHKARNGSPDVPKKVSPRASRSLKIGSLELDSSSSPVSATTKTPKDKSPKVVDRRSPRSPISEKKRPSRITELESLVTQLQEELKNAKEQLLVSETSKKQAEEEAEESKKQFQEASFKFSEEKEEEEETGKTDISPVVVHEIRQLKLQIEMIASSESLHVKQAELRNSEIQILRGNLMDTFFLVENFKNQVKDCDVTEAETEALATETLRQLKNAKKAVEELKEDGVKTLESYKKMEMELEKTKSKAISLEAMVSKLQTNPEDVEMELRTEVDRLKAVIEAVNVEASSRLRIQAELQSELKIAKAEIDEKDKLIDNLKADLMDKETEIQIVSDENETLKSDMHKREVDIQDVLMKLGLAMEEADKSSKRAVRVTEQLDATQASNTEMETELRKLKVQSNQWRKAAEAATAMLSAGETNSPYGEDGVVVDDEMMKKKNGNVLKKIGVLWKKPQK